MEDSFESGCHQAFTVASLAGRLPMTGSAFSAARNSFS